MLPDRVSNPGPLTYESGAPPIALRGPAKDRYPFLCLFGKKEDASLKAELFITTIFFFDNAPEIAVNLVLPKSVTNIPL